MLFPPTSINLMESSNVYHDWRLGQQSQTGAQTWMHSSLIPNFSL